jgi:hypothetical protein
MGWETWGVPFCFFFFGGGCVMRGKRGLVMMGYRTVSRDERQVRGWEEKAFGGTKRRAVPLSLDLTLE